MSNKIEIQGDSRSLVDALSRGGRAAKVFSKDVASTKRDLAQGEKASKDFSKAAASIKTAKPKMDTRSFQQSAKGATKDASTFSKTIDTAQRKKFSPQADTREFLRAVHEVSDAARDIGQGYEHVKHSVNAVFDKAAHFGKIGAGAAGGLAIALALDVKKASELETQLHNVYTIVDKNAKGAGNYSDQLLEMSTQFPQTAASLAGGLYDVVSSGVAADKAIEVLGVTSRAASAGMTDSAVASRAVVAGLNAYGMSADEATYVSDVMFQTVNKGVLTFDELANSMGDWVGMAASVKVPIDEASTAIATMTLKGINANEAGTSLNRVLQSFIKPSKDMTKAVKEMGYSNALTMLQSLGLHDTIMKLNDSVGGAPTKLQGMFKETRALRGVMALTSGGGKQYADVLGVIADKSVVAGSTSRAYAEQSKSLSVQMEIMRNTLDRIRIEIGSAFIPIIKKVVAVTTGWMNVWLKFPHWMKTAVAWLSLVGIGVLALGSYLLIAKAKSMAFAAGIRKVNRELSVNLPVTGSFTRMLVKMATAHGQNLPVLGRHITRLNQANITMGRAAIVGGMVAGAAFQGMLMWQGYANGIKNAKRETDDFLSSTSAMVTSQNDLSGRIKRDKAVIEEYDKLVKKYDDLSNYEFGKKWVSSTWGIITGNGAETANDENRLERLRNSLGLTAGEVYNLQVNLAGYSEALGISEAKVAELANRAGIKLYDKTESFEAIYAMKSLGLEVDATTLANLRHGKSLGTMVDKANVGIISYSNLQKQLDAVSGSVGILDEEVVKLDDSQKTLLSTLQEIGNGKSGFDDALQRHKEMVEKFGQAAVDAKTITVAEFEKMKKGVKLSLTDYKNSLYGTNVELLRWQADTIKVSRNVGQDVAMYIAGMGKDGVDLMHKMATGSGKETDEMAAVVRANMKLTGTSGAVELSAGMAVAAEAGRQGAKATRNAIAEELRLTVDDVAAISAQYGMKLAAGVNPVLESLGRDPITIASRTDPRAGRGYNADYSSITGPDLVGGRPRASVRYHANADGSLPDEAKFHKGHRLIQWAEPETDGEWFIPKAKSKRGRSEFILADVAREFGFQLHRMADGGFMSGKDVPGIPSYGQRGIFGQGNFGVFSETHDRVSSWMDKYLAMSGANANGLNPLFLSLFNRFNSSLGNILGIVSGFRTRAEQTRLYNQKGGYSSSHAGAARPGTSMHEKGLAIDHSPSSTGAMRSKARHYKLRYPMGNEPWHVQPDWAADGGSFARTIDRHIIRLFDSGGTLHPGMNAVFNNTGKPERLVRADGVGAGGGVAVTIDMRGAQVVGIEDLDSKLEAATTKMARKLTETLRKA